MASTMATTVTWVYQYEVLDMRDTRSFVKHSTFRTRQGIEQRGGLVLEHTGREVPGYEVDAAGMWKPDRNPVT